MRQIVTRYYIANRRAFFISWNVFVAYTDWLKWRANHRKLNLKCQRFLWLGSYEKIFAEFQPVYFYTLNCLHCNWDFVNYYLSLHTFVPDLFNWPKFPITRFFYASHFFFYFDLWRDSSHIAICHSSSRCPICILHRS